jgi:hypothetical protein
MTAQKKNILISGAMAGFIAGALTNGFQFMAVQMQTNPKMKFMEFYNKHGLRIIMTRGILFRCFHHSLFSCAFFYTFALMKDMFNVSNFIDD